MSALAVLLDAYRNTAVTEREKGSYDADCRVEKMKFGKLKAPDTGKPINDRSTVTCNNKITLNGTPEAAWDYVVNGKTALDGVMERQAVRSLDGSGKA